MPPGVGGGHTFERSILNAVQVHKSRHEFFIFINDSDYPESSSHRDSIKYIALKGNESPDSANNLAKTDKHGAITLNAAAVKSEIDIILFINPFSFQPVQLPYIYCVWDLQHRLQPYFPEVSVLGTTWDQRENLYKETIPKASYIITGNSVGKREIMEFYHIPEKRIKIIPFATPNFAVKQTDAKSQDLVINNKRVIDNFLYYPANFWPHKNHICILLAMRILRAEYGLTFDAIFTGQDSGNLAYIRAKAEEFGLAHAVHYAGFVPRELLCNLYKKAFALIYPSFFGPNNLPPLEAMALGCPVICSDADGMKEQLGDTAIFFNPKREDELAAGILELYSNDNTRVKLVQEGKKLAHSWSEDDYLRSILDLVEDFEPYKRCWNMFLKR